MGSARKMDREAAVSSLKGLTDYVNKNIPISEDETKQYLEKVAIMKKANTEMAFLNILDEIIDLTITEKIGQAELETEIPDGIIATIRDGDFIAEYVHSSITIKWISSRFSEDSANYDFSIKSDTLVQVVDKANQTFDLRGT